MAKLIDAEAVFNKIAGFSTTLHPNTLSAARVGEVIESMTAFLNSQPDASDPLLARIAELEEVLSTVREWISLRSPSPVQSIIAESIDKALAKGGQDA